MFKKNDVLQQLVKKYNYRNTNLILYCRYPKTVDNPITDRLIDKFLPAEVEGSNRNSMQIFAENTSNIFREAAVRPDAISRNSEQMSQWTQFDSMRHFRATRSEKRSGLNGSKAK
uniref:Uncharacterized protein n=1 Tax=Vespula pensylvanica TaxID=30213 RepID=A0A834U8H1_VESPE|nr:hypothetical protein H0235_009440 [Vespula pensylvanica]